MTETQASPEVVAVDAAQAAQVVRLRADESALPPGALFSTITPADGLPGAPLSKPRSGARAGAIRLTATLGPADSASTGQAYGLAARLGPVAVTLTILDRSGAAYQIAAGTLIADDRPHLLVASLGGEQAQYPLRVVAITAIATRAFMDANSLAIGSVVPEFLGGGGDPAANCGRGDLVPDRHRGGRRAHHRSGQPSGLPRPPVPSPAAGHSMVAGHGRRRRPGVLDRRRAGRNEHHQCGRAGHGHRRRHAVWRCCPR